MAVKLGKRMVCVFFFFFDINALREKTVTEFK